MLSESVSHNRQVRGHLPSILYCIGATGGSNTEPGSNDPIAQFDKGSIILENVNVNIREIKSHFDKYMKGYIPPRLG